MVGESPAARELTADPTAGGGLMNCSDRRCMALMRYVPEQCRRTSHSLHGIT
jgi:hypothetical protein